MCMSNLIGYISEDDYALSLTQREGFFLFLPSLVNVSSNGMPKRKRRGGIPTNLIVDRC